MKILHNTRCSKSRAALKLLEEAKVDIDIVNYLENPLTADELKEVLIKLDLPASALIRKSEEAYKLNFKGKTLSEDEWIEAMVKYPKLIERPIVIKGDQAVVGRPPENIMRLLDK